VGDVVTRAVEDCSVAVNDGPSTTLDTSQAVIVCVTVSVQHATSAGQELIKAECCCMSQGHQ